MIFGTVAGTVVASVKSGSLPAAKYLLVRTCDQTGAPGKDWHVALDDLGAGPGELVILSQGSSARQTALTDKAPVDVVVVGIVDRIDEQGKSVYAKG